MYIFTILFLSLFYIAPYISHTFTNLSIGFLSVLLSGSLLFQYMDTHNGFWTKKKLLNGDQQKITFNDTLLTVATNNIFGTIFSRYYLIYISDNGFGTNGENSMITILLQFGGCFLVFDMIFFVCHYIIHLPFCCKSIHKKHHLTFANMAITTHYMTFPDYMVEVVLPYWVALYIVNPCFTTSLLFVIFGQINGLITHSGYKFFGFPQPENHHTHHTKILVNYGSGGLSRIIEYFMQKKE